MYMSPPISSHQITDQASLFTSKYYDKVQTPWVWRPRDLEDEEEEASPTSETSPSNNRKNSDNPREDGEHFTSKRELQTTFSINIVRTPDYYRRNSVGSMDQSSPARTPSRGSRSSMESALSSRMSQMSATGSSNSIPKSITPNPLSRQSSMPTTLSSNSSFTSQPSISDTSTSMLGDQLSDEPVSMLSPLIMSHTPKPGHSPLRGLRANYTHPLLPSGLDPIPESNSRNLNDTSNKSKDRKPNPVGHASSMPLIPSQGYPSHHPAADRDRFRESKEQQGGLGSRHTTIIDHGASNPYSNPLQRSSSPSTSSPHHIPSSRSSSRQSSRSNSAHASPTYPSHHPSPPTNYTSDSRPSPPSKRSPPEYHHHHSSLSTSSVKTINPNSYQVVSSSTPGPESNPNIHISKIPNPLPPPPQAAPYGRPAYPIQRTPPAHHEHRIRRGFWNRRGDHLTKEGYIVYAPHEKAFPPELRNYPAEDEGYQDQDGVFTAYVNRPELPESLPRHGKHPELPYDSVRLTC